MILREAGMRTTGGVASSLAPLAVAFALLAAVDGSAGEGVSRFAPASGEAGSAPENLLVAGDSLYFAADDGIHGKELWRIDTEGNPRFVGDFCPGPEGSQPRSLVAVKNRLCFVGLRRSYDHRETLEYVWSTGGTAADTICVTLPLSQAKPGDTTLVAVGGGLYGAQTIPGAGREFVRFDEHSNWDIVSGRAGGLPKEQEYFDTIGSRLFFAVQAAGVSSRCLWVYEAGPDPNTIMPEPLSGDYFSIGFSIHCKVANGRVWFAGSLKDKGMELCVTDGTRAGTSFIRDIHPGPGDSTPKDFTAYEGIIYFQASDGTHGVELWRTDGTDAGTWMVKDINPGPWNSSPYNMCSIGSCLLFVATREDEGTELWRTDGTAEGTQLVLDIFPGANGSGLYQPTVYKDLLLFAADHPEYGEELWRSDGTAEGTWLVRDIHPGTNSGEPYHLTPFRNQVYFCANDGVHGEEVWHTDGTREGTLLAADIHPQTRVVRSGNPTNLTAAGKYVFFTADDLVHGNELWWSDVDTLETRMALDILPGREASNPEELVVFQDLLFFTADDGRHGRELWCCRAPDEVHLVADLFEGGASSNPNLLTPSELGLFFRTSIGGEEDAIYHLSGPNAVPERIVEPQALGEPLSIENLRVWGGHVYICGRGSDNRFRFAVLDPAEKHLDVLDFEIPEAVTWETVLAASSRAEPVSRDGLGEDLLQCYFSLPGMQERSVWFKNRWFFAARTAANGAELWTSSGSADSAAILYDCCPGTSSSSPGAFRVVDGELFFAAEYASKGRELWVTDGTVEGTHVVADWNGQTFNGAGPQHLTLHDNAVYYSAPGNGWYAERRALTKCEQTLNGLFVVTAAEPDRHWPDNPSELTSAGKWLYFAADHPATGRELWRYGEVAYPDGEGAIKKYTTYAMICNMGHEPGYGLDAEITERTWRKMP